MSLSKRSTWNVALCGVIAPLAVSLTLGVVGCESSPLAGTKVYPVRGKVLLPDGKPAATARIVFVGTKSGLTMPVPIESDGTFVVKGSLGEGLPEGEYKVRIEVDESKLPQVKGGPGQRSAALPFPEKYLDEDTSGLTATIKAGDNAPLEFTLNNEAGNTPQKQRAGRRDRS
jgi:hypothetical protein